MTTKWIQSKGWFTTELVYTGEPELVSDNRVEITTKDEQICLMVSSDRRYRIDIDETERMASYMLELVKQIRDAK